MYTYIHLYLHNFILSFFSPSPLSPIFLRTLTLSYHTHSLTFPSLIAPDLSTFVVPALPLASILTITPNISNAVASIHAIAKYWRDLIRPNGLPISAINYQMSYHYIHGKSLSFSLSLFLSLSLSLCVYVWCV